MKSKVTRKKVPAKKAAAPKKKKVQPIPAGYGAVTPYLSVRGAAQAIEFYKKAFGAKEIMRMPGPEGKLGHAEIKIGDSRVMLSDEYETMAFLSPQARGGRPCTSCHGRRATVACATAAGAKVTRPVQDQFYGDRTGSIEDPFGHLWHVATHKEDLSKAEMKRRAEQAAKEASG